MACKSYSVCEPCVTHGCIFGVMLDESKECVANTAEFTGDRIFQYFDGCDDLNVQIPTSYLVLGIIGWCLAALFCLALVACLLFFDFSIRRLDVWLATILQNEREEFAKSRNPDEPGLRQRRSFSQPPAVASTSAANASTSIQLDAILPETQSSPSKDKKVIPTFVVYAKPRFGMKCYRASSCPPSIDVPLELISREVIETVIEEEEETEFDRNDNTANSCLPAFMKKCRKQRTKRVVNTPSSMTTRLQLRTRQE